MSNAITMYEDVTRDHLWSVSYTWSDSWSLWSAISILIFVDASTSYAIRYDRRV